MSPWRHALAVAALPGVVTVVVPALIVRTTGTTVGWGLPAAAAVSVGTVGCLLLAVGVALLVRTVALFVAWGDGTLAPWDPTARLVVIGPYRRVRNPMISGVLFLLLGEAVLLGSLALLAWFAAALAVNAVYLPLVEERGLERRFGAEFERYRANVPRWLPRLRPWEPPS